MPPITSRSASVDGCAVICFSDIRFGQGAVFILTTADGMHNLDMVPILQGVFCIMAAGDDLTINLHRQASRELQYAKQILDRHNLFKIAVLAIKD